MKVFTNVTILYQYLLLLQFTERYEKLINFWNNVYGFNMKCMKADVVVEPNIETVPFDKVITKPGVLLDLDLRTCTTQAPDFSSEFKLEVKRDGTLTALAGYFDTFFESVSKPAKFSTGPHCVKTHWKQTVFYLKNTIDVKKGKYVFIIYFFMHAL